MHFYIPPPPISGFWLGPLYVHMYSVFMLAGALVLFELTNRRFIVLTGNREFTAFAVTSLLIPVILGARLWHVVSHTQMYEHQPFYKVFAIWEGGLGFIGGVFSGLICFFVIAKIKKVPPFTFLDALAPGILGALCFARLGNYFNGEVFGTETTLPWGLKLSHEGFKDLNVEKYFHPIFLYEIILNVFIIVILLVLEKRVFVKTVFPKGSVFAAFLVLYGLGRFALEPMRYNLQQNSFGLDLNYVGAAAMIIVGVLIACRHTIASGKLRNSGD
ncbi:prolipoprotein diacylglyceryl transferase [Tropheryma whipplei]|uniref:prolipoprotein diacylglyceryl transferase n=1 Tax=Tropheryma whipplei TaxID=2039 RepID=UPI0005A9E57F|nr:prolipoprotein diacylglyceryl transferase [Tropheryma whipplei]